MTELKAGTCSENEEVEEYEETKAPQENDYSIYKEHNHRRRSEFESAGADWNVRGL